MVMSLRDWSLFTGRGGGPKKLENRGPETFCASKQGKTFCAPLIKSGNFFVTLPLIWL